jgi:hypothetical protein
MLNTNVPVDRLGDWVDQSILRLHLGSEEDGKERRRKLQRLGVRTATDIEDLYSTSDEELRAALDRYLNEDGKGPGVLGSVRLSRRREPNLYHVQAWKSYPWSIRAMRGTAAASTRTLNLDEDLSTGDPLPGAPATGGPTSSAV